MLQNVDERDALIVVHRTRYPESAIRSYEHTEMHFRTFVSFVALVMSTTTGIRRAAGTLTSGIGGTGERQTPAPELNRQGAPRERGGGRFHRAGHVGQHPPPPLNRPVSR